MAYDREKKRAADKRRYHANKEKYAAANKRWMDKNPDRIRARHIKRTYGLSFEAYNQMLTEQKGKCAVCGTIMVKPCVDHCHETGEIRGILCNPCNNGIGQLGDDLESVLRAAEYLRRASALRGNSSVN